MKYIIQGLVVLLFISCSYSVYTSGYPHLKTIQVLPLENLTDNYELRDLVFNMLTDSYESDGRLKLVSLSPDCQLECSILDYSNKILTYSSSTIDEYEVRVLFSVTLTDLVKNQVIWSNSQLLLSENYSQLLENNKFTSEIEAQEEIIVILFDTLMKNTLEEW